MNELEARQDPRLLRALDTVAPGTPLREGIDNIVHARTGGLILVAELDGVSFLFSGGIKLDVDYTPALLYQVAKMDGAIVLARRRQDQAGQRAVDAGPDHPLDGDRHAPPDRGARLEADQGAGDRDPQRRDVVSLYIEGMKYILQDILTVLSKANQVWRRSRSATARASIRSPAG